MAISIAGAEAPEGSDLVALEARDEDLGRLPRSEVPARLFARATATLVTSTITEAFSLVAIESLAAGTPVVAYDRGALREVIEDGVTGILVPPGDLEAAARACKAIAAGAIDRARCREHAVERFDHARTIDLFLQLYTSR
jgi:glycosyltransferase involved in cell wall biosynthesis